MPLQKSSQQTRQVHIIASNGTDFSLVSVSHPGYIPGLWTHALDSGLWTEIWTGFWTDTQFTPMLILECWFL